MSKLEDRAPDELRQMFLRREGDVAAVPPLDHGVRERVRRRQSALVLSTSAVVLVVVLAAVVGTAVVGDTRRPAVRPKPTVITTVQRGDGRIWATMGGLTVLTPQRWTRLDLWSGYPCVCGVNLGPHGHVSLKDLPTMHRGVPIVTVSNYVAALPVTGSGCPTAPPPGGVAMWIALDTWRLAHHSIGTGNTPISAIAPAPGPCGLGHYAERMVGGLPYLAYAVFAPDAAAAVRHAVDDSWASLSSAGPDGLYLTRNAVAGYVLATGSAGGPSWLLTASVFGDPLSLIAGATAGPGGFTGATVPPTPGRDGISTAEGVGHDGQRVIAVAFDLSRGTPVFRPNNGSGDLPLTKVPLAPQLRIGFGVGYIQTSLAGRVVEPG